ncbi:class I SAM-dependent RNA methyltransferase [Fluviispira sanaruensis]|uniref:23S rRNA (Uracil(1939)-C(5))-methyltransferase RlmD n=1 Tax=Fluviispira sanaruensis TaxID=2493639 RepID=A0A4P2VLQ7_FLUSA|nr:class I SAM-dependent RNA methyltransferase [Fluviispira sanaruensis]BBH52914.1 23S rRNA (uracil(1939)-C(5))-methyltransferase RlmD [Fluviispira sanaruensis]
MQYHRNRQKSFHSKKSHLKANHNPSIKHEKETLTSYAMSTDGKAIARSEDGIIVFVKDMIENETAKVEIVHKKSNFKNAIALKIENPSPHRVEPPCNYISKCGGCQLQHIAPEMQSVFKSRWFFETLKRIGKWDSTNINLSEKILSLIYLKKEHYRRRVRFHFNGKDLGFKENNSNNIVDISHCLISSLKINEKIAFLKDNLSKAFNEIQEKKFSRQMECEIELTECDDEKVVLNIAQFNVDQEPNKEICLTILEKYLTIQNEQIIHLKHPELPRFRLKKQSFIQPHMDCIALYYQHIKEAADEFLKSFIKSKSEKKQFIAWDLYSGAGIFTALPYFAGKRFDLNVQCFGVEGIKEAIDSLNNNCKNLPVTGIINNVEIFIDKEFKKKLEQPENYKEVDLLILDPPRAGSGIEAMQKIVELCSKKSLVVYLACDPASFARDTRVLLEGGFRLKNLNLFDAFGHTVHYEVLGCFERGNG